MIFADIKTDEKQEVKELVALLYLITFYRSTLWKLEMQCKTRLYFSFNFGWNSIQLDIVR